MAFEGIRPVLHMPFGDSGDQPILEAELQSLAGHMLAAGSDGLVVLGLASEAWALTEAERDRIVEIAADACSSRAPLVVGIDGATAVARDRARRAGRLGAAGLMVLPPRQAIGRAALVQHFGAIADAAELPVLIQDSPQVSGVTLDVSAIVAITEAHPLISSVKAEIPGAGAKSSALSGEGVELVAGWGGLGYLEQIDRGATGCMPGCDLGPAMVVIDRAARSGDRAEAQALYRQILPLLSFATASLDLLLLTAKRHLRRSGIFSTEVLRAPGRAADDHEVRTIDDLLDELVAAEAPGFGGGTSRLS